MINKGYLLGERYRIIDTLGEGGMANVYLADDIILQRLVAVKIIRLDLQKDEQVLARFQREALATSELSHPNIVSVFDVGTDHGLPYMVMEYVKGPDLKEYIRKNSPIPLPRVIKIMDQILSAIALAHNHNVIHRDLKPQNILMDENGNVKIADFGIAVALNQTTITQTNSVMGSVHYMSPEQTRGGMVTKQSDIYSLGIILYELLTGSVPFDGSTPVSIALKHAEEQLPSIRKQNSHIPQALENVVLKAAAKDPRDRYATAEEMKTDLDTSLDPSRANEPRFIPEHDNNEETKILPAFSGKVTNDTSHDSSSATSKTNKEKKSSFWENLKSHKWWWIGAIIPVLAIVIIMCLSIGHNNVRVPNVTGMTQNAAEASLKGSGLEVGSITKEPSEKIKKGNVLSTKPTVNAQVSKGRTIDIVVSSGPALTKVPNVEGLYLSSARKKLTKLGFKVKIKRVYSDEYEENVVISQNVKSGKKVVASKKIIRLLVSSGTEAPADESLEEDSSEESSSVSKSKNESEDDSFSMNDLTGKSLDEARSYAQSHDLSLKIKEEYSDSVDKGNIISTSPSAGTKLNEGDSLTVTVSKGVQEKTVRKTFSVQYEQAGNDSGDDSSSDSSSEITKNHIQIYIQDDNHSIGNIYRDLYITKDADFTVPFTISKNNGRIKIVRDGDTVINESVSPNE